MSTKQPSIQGENGYVTVQWNRGGKTSWFSGFDSLSLDDFRLLDQALTHPEFREEFMEWVHKQRFMDALRG